MHYKSTRGKSSGLTFEEALFEGLAPDGGLYIPQFIPLVTEEEYQSWAHLTFPELAFHIFRLYIDCKEIPDDDLRDILDRSFATFTHPHVTPLVDLPSPENKLQRGYILELFHGPTFAFKDVALQVVGNLFEYFLARRNADAHVGDRSFITVIGATSGDTGGAAIYGLKGKKDCQVFILHPKGRISPIQEAQMTSILDDNVINMAIDGATFDDCQEIVKTLFNDHEFKKKYRLAAINSINWARILSQTVYYFKSYFDLLNKTGNRSARVQYCVPTGNFGDILAGYYALRMGLPIHKLIVATNENDILYRFFTSGKYEKMRDANGKIISDCVQTLSPAMDILVSSNFERLCWYLLRGDERGSNPDAGAKEEDAASEEIVKYMSQLKTEGGFTMDPAAYQLSQGIFGSMNVSNSDTRDCIERYFHQLDRNYILDPHTAVGVVAAERMALVQHDPELFTICLSTASPGKFPDVVLEALNEPKGHIKIKSENQKKYSFSDIAPLPLVKLEGLEKRCLVISMAKGQFDKGVEAVREAIVERCGTLLPV